MLRRVSRSLVILTSVVGALSAATIFAAQPSAETAGATGGEDLRVWLVTIGPGDHVWERYGHNALRFLNTRNGNDVSYNWGIFDFNQADFIPRFLQGRMLYQMAPFPTAVMVDMYGRANREVVQQELALTPEQKRELLTLAQTNALPENRDYIYQYFLDNCSTRIRDLLDRVLDGALRAEFGERASGTSYRDHSRRLTEVDPLIYTGQDFLLGAPTDSAITVWEEMFLPLTLRDEIRRLETADHNGARVPFVIAEEVTVAADRPAEPATPSNWLAGYLLLGVILGGSLAALASERVQKSVPLRRGLLSLAVAWSIIGGVVGTILLLLLFTDHVFSYRNENLFLFSPLTLALALMLPFSRRSGTWEARTRRLALGVAGLAVVGLLWQLSPTSVHQNAMFFALALPAHVGLAWALNRRTPLQ